MATTADLHLDAPYEPWERSILALRFTVDLVGLVVGIAGIFVFKASGALERIENKMNLNIVVPMFILTVMFVLTDGTNLYYNKFSLSFAMCQLYGFTYAVCESLTLLTLWLVCGWHYYGVVLGQGRIITDNLKVILIGLWGYCIAIGTFPIWPQVSDVYELRPCKWVCYWKIESSKPNMIFWIAFALYGILATPPILFYGYSKVGAHIDAKMQEFARSSNIKQNKDSLKAQRVVKMLVQRAKMTAVAFMVLFYTTASEMLVAMITRRPPPAAMNMVGNFCLAVLSAVTPIIFVVQDDRCRLYVINTIRRIRKQDPLTLESFISGDDDSASASATGNSDTTRSTAKNNRSSSAIAQKSGSTLPAASVVRTAQESATRPSVAAASNSVSPSTPAHPNL